MSEQSYLLIKVHFAVFNPLQIDDIQTFSLSPFFIDSSSYLPELSSDPTPIFVNHLRFSLQFLLTSSLYIPLLRSHLSVISFLSIFIHRGFLRGFHVMFLLVVLLLWLLLSTPVYSPHFGHFFHGLLCHSYDNCIPTPTCVSLSPATSLNNDAVYADDTLEWTRHCMVCAAEQQIKSIVSCSKPG
ncbi:unnamed protein product [Schistocephalus solidus]|uniref:Ovule protein n=1 Tax=Schistocephalus solidus TaxID=70667 RepID=A0A183SFX9_SCHSO|nr:unnamed protein product [Schistocephalus solidus]